MNEILGRAVERLRAGDVHGAEGHYREFLRHFPDNAQVLCLFSQVCYRQGRIADSTLYLERARTITPGDAAIHYSLGALYTEQGERGKAVEAYKVSLYLRPSNDDALSNLGTLYYELQRYGEAIECLIRAVRANSRNEKAYFNLGLALMQVGKAADADRMFRAARDLAPGNDAISSCLLFNLHNIAGLTNEEIFSEHRRWAGRFESQLAGSVGPPRLSRDDETIRVGYVSADFQRHPVFYFINPVLKNHDSSAFTTYGYSDVLRPDDATRQLMGAAHQWRDISKLSNDQVFRMIRDDRIDILVDLGGHTNRNRLPVFAAKPAPIQVSWLGYPDTTGLRAMDYRLTDARADPAGESDDFCTETLVRLERGFLCYDPPASSPGPGDLPVFTNGFVTFGSFNSLAKVTDEVISAWSEILRRVTGARMILKAKGLGDATGRAGIVSGFQSHGIDPDRIECLGIVADMEHHLDAYNRIDIALDTFPYNGTTTTCEALWMGVPVITLAGNRHVSRVGASLLATAGLAECVVNREDAYIERAISLAGDAQQLEVLRTGLRDRLRASPLMDHTGFTRMMEGHFRLFMERLDSA
jgi:predicted O-linked N-acetylglucosamine transferase (SPINDLY family)